jgi:hypothetical protein
MSHAIWEQRRGQSPYVHSFGLYDADSGKHPSPGREVRIRDPSRHRVYRYGAPALQARHNYTVTENIISARAEDKNRGYGS